MSAEGGAEFVGYFGNDHVTLDGRSEEACDMRAILEGEDRRTVEGTEANVLTRLADNVEDRRAHECATEPIGGAESVRRGNADTEVSPHRSGDESRFNVDRVLLVGEETDTLAEERFPVFQMLEGDGGRGEVREGGFDREATVRHPCGEDPPVPAPQKNAAASDGNACQCQWY